MFWQASFYNNLQQPLHIMEPQTCPDSVSCDASCQAFARTLLEEAEDSLEDGNFPQVEQNCHVVHCLADGWQPPRYLGYIRTGTVLYLFFRFDCGQNIGNCCFGLLPKSPKLSICVFLEVRCFFFLPGAKLGIIRYLLAIEPQFFSSKFFDKCFNYVNKMIHELFFILEVEHLNLNQLFFCFLIHLFGSQVNLVGLRPSAAPNAGPGAAGLSAERPGLAAEDVGAAAAESGGLSFGRRPRTEKDQATTTFFAVLILEQLMPGFCWPLKRHTFQRHTVGKLWKLYNLRFVSLDMFV